ncbi:hypothetical protein EYR36_000364 [Pleurotus pulmonarius]|nr:hypothetical protein EYR36_000364 [Pleurotus pulmonarius]
MRIAATGTLVDDQSLRTGIPADVATIDLTDGTTTGLTLRDLARTQSHIEDLATLLEVDRTVPDETNHSKVVVEDMAEETMMAEDLIPGRRGVEGMNRPMGGRGLVAETTETGIETGIEESTTATTTVGGEMAHPPMTVVIVRSQRLHYCDAWTTRRIVFTDYGDRQRRSRSPPPRRRPSSPPPPRSPSDSRYSRPKSPGHYSSPLWRPPPRDDTPPPRTSPPRTTVKQEEHRTVPPLKEEPMLPAIVRHSVNSNEPLDVKPSPIKQEPAVRGRSPTPIKTEPTPAPLPPKKEYPSDPPANVVNARPVDDRTEDNDVKMKDQSEPSIPTHPRQHLRTTNLDRIQSPHSRLDSPSGSSHPNQRRPSPPRFNRQVSDRHPRYDGPPNRPNKPYHHKHEPGKIHPQLASAELNYIFPLKFEEPIPLPPDVQQLQARREQLRKSALIVYRQRAALELVELQLVNALDAENLASIDVAAAKSRQRAIDQTLAALEAATTSESSSSSGQPPGAAADATLATAVS